MADRHDEDEPTSGDRVENENSEPSSSDVAGHLDGSASRTEQESPAEHIDLSAIQADDALLDALGGTDPTVGEEDSADQDLSAMLVAWRREADAEPFGELVDIDTAVATIAAARPPARRRPRFLVPLATAAAVLAITFTGVSVAAREARPGDTLWGLSRVLFTEHANSVEAAVAVQGELDAAEAALFAGRFEQAAAALQRAGASLDSVSDDDGHAHLRATHDRLRDQLDPAPQPEDGEAPEDSESTTDGGEPPLLVDTTTEQPPPTSPTDDSETSPPDETTTTPPEEPTPSSPPAPSTPPSPSTPSGSEPDTSTGSRTENISTMPSGGE
ncbi:hypothetical protein FHR81_005192 [Actinoalloteichus hoggarensis]|uniref:Anti-sigma-D factor RsdA n=1 Tax=Actinoalloteichus hoggarensis TaxID=1470176 RepID=A0A221WAR5_9PSEU|nr:anti-sigma-D factor RsdA [Actinoalloteichus hoggarensis]ASO22743.1 Anti-sigma-D factor RsdA [Actinoalloteichus hoggarensis]MBB5924115.1 hypothetical protein [Actinoalloteichus hoggarensis]